MVPAGTHLRQILRAVFQRPWSMLMAAVAVGMVVYSLWTRITGHPYVERLGCIDRMTIATRYDCENTLFAR